MTTPQPEQSALLPGELSSAWSAWRALRDRPALRPLLSQVRLTAETGPRPLTVPTAIRADGIVYIDPWALYPTETWQRLLLEPIIALCLGSPHTAAERTAILHRLGFPDDGVSESAAPPVIVLIPPDSAPLDGALDGGTWTALLSDVLLRSEQKTALKPTRSRTQAGRALAWFVDEYPLLGALAAHFDISEDLALIARFEIKIAAVAADHLIIFINPEALLSDAEMRFIIAHEMLHVALLHHRRAGDREPFPWNIACDYIINAWLRELGVGAMVRGGMFNPEFRGWSADEIYDHLYKKDNPDRTANDLKAANGSTFAGEGRIDILPSDTFLGEKRVDGIKLTDEQIKSWLRDGLRAHLRGARGLLPAGLVETVTPVAAPAPPWQVSLGVWLDARVAITGKAAWRFARPSRRQSATPDIPRPSHTPSSEANYFPTFGVVIDSSGSMTADFLGRGLGALAALAARLDVAYVRLIACDTVAYDEGYVAVERLAQPISVRGRGGTVLQPGIDLLEGARDFPPDAPILIITDGDCDTLVVKREHAYLLPLDGRIRFDARGPVFKIG